MNLSRANYGTPPVHGREWMLRYVAQQDREEGPAVRASDVHSRWQLDADGWEQHPGYAAAGWRMALAGAVYEQRTVRSWTEADLAEAAGLTEDQVEDIECSGADPTPDILQALGHAFRADVLFATAGPEPGVRFITHDDGHNGPHHQAALTLPLVGDLQTRQL
ncbi:helix-turn-helix domain-containing protein [Streptomyces sp. NRRL B-24484]|uniref:helix-turn-helix domain-containing protein n=1 Tax=Streptomyces sp. NRRL B-24484 TaxID=1463833 RepID=UPI001331990A|nr:helix-turn-helix transcriptional regulator [Streptomyces sp. NRRL B-24484]